MTDRSPGADALHELFELCHARSFNGGWWTDPVTGISLIPDSTFTAIEGEAGKLLTDIRKAYFPYVIGTKIALIHSEVSEALEGYRTDATDDKLSHRSALEVELADAIIRIGDLAACLHLDVAGAIEEKMAYNKVRPDHKADNRRKPGGKKF